MISVRNLSCQRLNPRARNERFIPRYLDIHMMRTTRENPHALFDAAHYLLDTFSHGMEILNLSHYPVSIAHRDGSVSVLRNTNPETLQELPCYRPRRKFNAYGALRYQADKTEDRAACYPPGNYIEPGLYISTWREVTISPLKRYRKDGKITTVAAKGQGGRVYYGNDAEVLLASHREEAKSPSDGNNEATTFNPYPAYRNPRNRFDDEYNEPTHFGPTLTTGNDDNTDGPTFVGGRDFGGEIASSYRRKEVVRIEYFVSEKEILEMHGDIGYLHALDIAIGIGIDPDEMYHPESQEGKLRFMANQLSLDTADIYGGIVIKNIDNTPQKSVGSYYCNVGTSIIEIPGVYDPKREPGVYFFLKNVKSFEDEAEEIEYKFVPHHEVIGLNIPGIPRLYRTYAEALEAGDLKASRDAHWKEELRMKEMEHKERLQQMEYEKLQREKELAEAKHELELLKARMAEREAMRKDRYEERSYERKDSSEMWKWMMGIVAIVMPIVITILKASLEK